MTGTRGLGLKMRAIRLTKNRTRRQQLLNQTKFVGVVRASQPPKHRQERRRSGHTASLPVRLLVDV